MTLQEYESLCRDLKASGYTRYINNLDYEAVMETGCEASEKHQMDAEGFKKPGSYRAFAICEACNEVHEF